MRALASTASTGAPPSRSRRVAPFGPLPGGLEILAHEGADALLDLGTEDGIVRLMSAWNDPRLVVLDTLGALAGLDGDPNRRERPRPCQ